MPLTPSTDPSQHGLASPICWKCDYLLTSLPQGHPCPECGFSAPPHELILRGRFVDFDERDPGSSPFKKASYFFSTPEKQDRRLHFFPTGFATRDRWLRKSHRWTLGDNLVLYHLRDFVCLQLGRATPFSGTSVCFPGTPADTEELHALLLSLFTHAPPGTRRPLLTLR